LWTLQIFEVDAHGYMDPTVRAVGLSALRWIAANGKHGRGRIVGPRPWPRGHCWTGRRIREALWKSLKKLPDSSTEIIGGVSLVRGIVPGTPCKLGTSDHPTGTS